MTDSKMYGFHLHLKYYENAFCWSLQTFLKIQMKDIDYRLNVCLNGKFRKW